MSKNFVDRFYEEDVKDQFWSLNKKIGVGLAIIFLVIIMVNTTGCTPNQSSDSAEDVMNLPAAEEQPKQDVKVGNDGVNAAIADDSTNDVAIVAEEKDDTKMIAMSVEDTGRADPFLPEEERVASTPKPKPKPPSYLMAPPEAITQDPDAVKVVQTKVSGIMYDKYNPSAILNINGADHLVRSGDIINDYKVLSINHDTVTVQLGQNVYKAGVGQLFTGEGINYNSVANIQNKFGGSGNTANKRR